MTVQPIALRSMRLVEPPDLLIRLIEASEDVSDTTVIRLLDDPDDESTWSREALLGNLRAERKQKELYKASSSEHARMVVELREQAAGCTCGAFSNPHDAARERAWPELGGKLEGM